MSDIGWTIIEIAAVLAAVFAGLLFVLLFAIWVLWSVFGGADDLR